MTQPVFTRVHDLLSYQPTRRRPPGPAWYTSVHNTLYMLQNALGFLMQMQERYGDVVCIPMLFGSCYVVFHPDGVQHILQENHRNYNKDVPDYHVLRLVLGKGLLTNDGESWLRLRRLIQPAFHRERVTAFGTLMTDTTLTWTQRWETSGFVETNKPLDLTQQMSSLTLNIVGKAPFATDLSAETERVGRALTGVNHLLASAFYLPWVLSLPTPQRHRLYTARRELYTVVEEIIRGRRRRPA